MFFRRITDNLHYQTQIFSNFAYNVNFWPIDRVGFAQQIPAQNETVTTGDGFMTHSCARWRAKQKKAHFYSRHNGASAI